MSSQDLTDSTSILEASSDFALQIGSTTASNPSTSEINPARFTETQKQSWLEEPYLIVPSFQPFQIETPSAMIVGYNYEEGTTFGEHYVHLSGSPDPAVLRAKMLKLACHFMVDLTPPSGLEEMLEKALEIKDYYCTLGNWDLPKLPPEAASVPFNPVSAIYEREALSLPEE